MDDPRRRRGRGPGQARPTAAQRKLRQRTPAGPSSWDTGKRCAALSTEEAYRALAEGVPGCPPCQPDVALGVPE
ncbi:DUF6233 domain-containing protein [Streptomyces sp. NPDC003042]